MTTFTSARTRTVQLQCQENHESKVWNWMGIETLSSLSIFLHVLILLLDALDRSALKNRLNLIRKEMTRCLDFILKIWSLSRFNQKYNSVKGIYLIFLLYEWKFNSILFLLQLLPMMPAEAKPRRVYIYLSVNMRDHSSQV